MGLNNIFFYVEFDKIFKIFLQDVGLKFVKNCLLNGLLNVMILVFLFLFLFISLVCMLVILLLKYDLKFFVNFKLDVQLGRIGILDFLSSEFVILKSFF